MKFELAITKMFALLLPAGAWIKKLISSPALLNPFAPEPPVTARGDPCPFYPLWRHQVKLTIKFAGILWTLVKWGNVKINCLAHKHIT